MDNGVYSKVTDISLHLECQKCPVKLKSASIIYDSEKNLQLLRVAFSNSGKRTVDAIYLKLVFYDNYENIVPDNDKEHKIWGLSGLDLQPGTDDSDDKMLVLPGTEVLDCDILITKIIYSDGEVLHFSKSDYISPISKIGQRIAVFDGKKGKKILISSIAAVIAIYAMIVFGTYLVRDVIIPLSEKAHIENLIEKHRYDKLLSLDEISGNRERNDALAKEAIEYYVSAQDYHAAVDTVWKIQDTDLKSLTISELGTVLVSAKRYDLAKELAIESENTELRKAVICEAIDYYCSINEYGKALEYASVSGNAERKYGICSEAITFHLNKNDYNTALQYAGKVEGDEFSAKVYEAAIKNTYEAEDYNLCALYIAQSGLYPNEIITSEYIEDVFSKADKSYIRANLKLFYPLMSFEHKQLLFATTADVYKSAVGITEENKVTGFSSQNWSSTVSVKISELNTVALKSDGKVIVYGENSDSQCSTKGWSDIVAIASGGNHTVGVRADGTAVAVGRSNYGQCNVSGWSGVVEVAAGKNHTVGLKADGTVVAVGSNEYGQCDVSDWNEIAAISCGDYHTVGLRHDGTVVAVGNGDFGRCSVSEWTDIIQISAGATHTVGLHSNGTPILIGNTAMLYCGDVSTWCDIKSISAGYKCTMGLTSTGKILISGDGAPKTGNMKNIKLPPNN